MDPIAEEERGVDGVVRGGAAGVLGVAGAEEPLLLAGVPLATPLSNSSRGSSLWACTSFMSPSSRWKRCSCR